MKITSNKDTYDRMSKEKRNLRKDEPFVLRFRNFIFFDVKSYECRNGDLYIRNIVDGVILKRYFRMNGEDQLTVFKNRAEFDEFMDKVKEEGYMFGPQKSIQSYGDNLSGSINNDFIGPYTQRYTDLLKVLVLLKHGKIDEVKKMFNGALAPFLNEDGDIGPLVSALKIVINSAYRMTSLKKTTDEASNQFILENFTATRNSETGKIDLITSTWDGSSITRDECPGIFDDVVRVLEANPGSAQIFNRNDFM